MKNQAEMEGVESKRRDFNPKHGDFTWNEMQISTAKMSAKYMGTAEINRKGPSVLNCFVVSNWFLNPSNPGCRCDK